MTCDVTDGEDAFLGRQKALNNVKVNVKEKDILKSTEEGKNAGTTIFSQWHSRTFQYSL